MDNLNQTIPPVQPMAPSQPADPKDVEDNKVLAIIGYIGILCLVPLLGKKESKFAQFHGKQGLVLLIAWIIVCAVMMVPFLGWIIGFFGHIVCFILMIVGIVNAAEGKEKELPWIGYYAAKINL